MSKADKISGIFKNKKVIIMTAVIGLFLVIICNFIPQSMTYSSQEKSGETLEKKLEQMLMFASGCDNVKVMITFKQDEIIDSETKSNSSFFSPVVTDKTSSLSNINADIAGVMVVIRGITEKSDFKVIKSAVSTVLDISQNQIYIVGG